MTNPETRGYLVGLNENGQFSIPEKLMEKIVTQTGDTALMIWLPYKKTLQVQPVSAERVIKFTIWFDALTHTIFESKLNPTMNAENEALIFKTGVLFPSSVDEKSSIEYYFSASADQLDKLHKLKDSVEKIEGVAEVDILQLEKFRG